MLHSTNPNPDEGSQHNSASNTEGRADFYNSNKSTEKTKYNSEEANCKSNSSTSAKQLDLTLESAIDFISLSHRDRLNTYQAFDRIFAEDASLVLHLATLPKIDPFDPADVHIIDEPI